MHYILSLLELLFCTSHPLNSLNVTYNLFSECSYIIHSSAGIRKKLVFSFELNDTMLNRESIDKFEVFFLSTKDQKNTPF